MIREKKVIIFLLIFFRATTLEMIQANDSEQTKWNTMAPFAYLHGSSRSWPVALPDRKTFDTVKLQIIQNEKTLASGHPVQFDGFRISLDKENRLVIQSTRNSPRHEFDLKLTLLSRGKETFRQTLHVQPAPPDRPITYLADLIDDLIGFFYDSSSHQFEPIVKEGLDQYFRRVQAQGIKRLIVWQSPFPFSAKPEDFSEPVRTEYLAISKALTTHPELNQSLANEKALTSWKWQKLKIQLTSTPEFGEILSKSARDHGISLTASFRPFESALQKYYVMPAFDQAGHFLQNIHYSSYAPFNIDQKKYGFAHYRMILGEMGLEKYGEISSLELLNVANRDSILEKLKQGTIEVHLSLSQYPPIDPNSYVLVRQTSGNYQLTHYESIQDQCLKTQKVLTCQNFAKGNEDSIILTGLEIPLETRFIRVEVTSTDGDSITMSTDDPVRLISKAGTPLGKFNSYRVMKDITRDQAGTRVAPLFPNGTIRSQFDATRNSENYFLSQPEQVSFQESDLMIDRGDPYTDEMLDFGKPATRKMAIKQIKDMLSYPAFDEILINTRSHTQLAGSWGDRSLGVRPTLEYRRNRKPYRQIGLDCGYAPLSIAKNKQLIHEIQNNPKALRDLTHHYSNEWESTAQEPTRPVHWRYLRNKAIAEGVRFFLEDLRKELPQTRIRIVLPPSAQVEQQVKQAISQMKREDGTFYSPEYFRYLCSYLNYIPAIGEGITMVNLDGLNMEPVLLGYRGLPNKSPRQIYLEEFLGDLRSKHSYKGPYSFFYEAQETLRIPADQNPQEKREEIIRELLKNREDIKEVILYEAADWIRYLPIRDQVHGQHGYLE